MKNTVKYILQKLLGFQTYLFVFSVYKIQTLRSDSKEKDFFHFLKLLKNENGDVLDVGANLGIMTVHLALKLPKSTIHAFEPIPSNFKTLKKITEKFKLKNIQLYETAVGEEEGNVKMVLPTNGKTKMQGLSHVKHESITEWNEGEEFEVPLSTLDNLIGEKKVQGIKIDIENFEFFALKGATNLLKRDTPIIYAELWDNQNRTNCFELLKAFGYTPFIVLDDVLVEFDATKHKNQNFIFLSN